MLIHVALWDSLSVEVTGVRMAALDVLPWDLFNYGKARLEKNKTAAQLRSECQLRSIEVSSSADKDECVKKLLDWKRRSQNAPTSVDPNVNTADAKDFQTVSQIGPKIAEAILNEVSLTLSVPDQTQPNSTIGCPLVLASREKRSRHINRNPAPTPQTHTLPPTPTLSA